MSKRCGQQVRMLFVNWAGHGSPDAAYEYYPSQPFVDEDTCVSLNDEYPSIVFADSCSNSDTDYLNIGQAMMKQGAIGSLDQIKLHMVCMLGTIHWMVQVNR